MHFINQVNFEATTSRGILNVIQQFSRIFHLSPAGGVDFDQINETALIDLRASGTGFTGFRRHALFTIEAFGQDSSKRRLTYSPGSCKQIGVVKTLIIKRIDQRFQNVALPGDFGKLLRAPFSGENLVAHGVRGYSVHHGSALHG